MDQNQALQPAQEVVEKKRAAWGNLGVTVHHTELTLQAKAQEIAKLLVVPTKTDELPIAEQALKNVTRQRDALVEDRKKITSKLDDISARLMLPEKSLQQSISNFTAELIKIKQQAALAAAANKNKQLELTQIAESVRIYVADINAAYLTEQAKLISDSYKYALDNIPPENIAPYLEKVKARITVAKRTMPPPVVKAIHNTQEAIDAEILKVFKPLSAQDYIDGFATDLALKYSDYKLAWQNKEQAIEVNAREESDNQTAIANQKQQEVVAANVRSMATPVVVGHTTKDLKEVYKLSMEETFENANIIIQAYLSNLGRCKAELRTTKWFSGFGVKQMIGALEKIKNDDGKFQFDGLVWTTENKL